MARIRSLHPGLFTDEAFVALSPFARLLCVGLWTECDDHGVFEWKPIGLKMRLLPADNVDAESLLGELEAANVVQKFSSDGKYYGAVRNFTRFQRPKKPVSKHPLPHQYRTYVGLADASSPPVPHQFPTSGEIPPQMEEEGGEEREGKKEKKDEDTPAACQRRPKRYVFEQGVIRLTQSDFDRWQRAFKHCNLEAELTGLAEWAGRPQNVGNWFHAVSGALAKRDRQIAAERERMKLETAAGGKPTDWKAAIL